MQVGLPPIDHGILVHAELSVAAVTVTCAIMWALMYRVEGDWCVPSVAVCLPSPIRTACILSNMLFTLAFHASVCQLNVDVLNVPKQACWKG